MIPELNAQSIGPAPFSLHTDFSVWVPGNEELSFEAATFETAHAAKWEMIQQGHIAEVVNRSAEIIVESDPVLVVTERLCKILSVLAAQNRLFHLDDDPADFMDNGIPLFSEHEIEFLVCELALARQVLGEDALWDSAAPFMELSTDPAPVHTHSFGM